MVEAGAALFDELVVAIGVNPQKRTMFSVDGRLAMLRSATSGLANVRVETFTNQYLIAYAQQIGARFIVRGIRSESDYEYERTMRNINGDLDAAITTVFLMPPRGIAEVSSSMVKGLVGPVGWERIVEGYVPAAVFERLKEVHYGNASKGK